MGRVRSRKLPRAGRPLSDSRRPDEGLAKEAFDGWGVLLTLSRKFPAAADVFAGEEYEAKLEAHAERVAREDPEVGKRATGRKSVIPRRSKTNSKCNKKYGYKLPPKIIRENGEVVRVEVKWDDLKLVSCRRCHRGVLGFSFRWVHRAATEASMGCLPYVPQPVAAETPDGGPLCPSCVMPGDSVLPDPPAPDPDWLARAKRLRKSS